jgi:hypothetical protein
VLVTVDCKVAVVEVDHRGLVPMNRERANTRTPARSAKVAQVVEVAQRLDPDCSLDGLPVAAVEIAEVEVAVACIREQQRTLCPRP